MGTRLLIIEFSGGGPPEYKPGQSVRSAVQITQLPAYPATIPVLFDPLSTPVLTVQFPDGTQATPTVVRDSVGLYHGDYWIPLSMQYGPGFERWQCVNAAISNNATSERRFTVRILDFVGSGSGPTPTPPVAIVRVYGGQSDTLTPGQSAYCDPGHTSSGAPYAIGGCTVTLAPVNDGDPFTLVDTGNSCSPTNPINVDVTGPAGITIENPSNPGTFSSGTVQLVQQSSSAYYEYDATKNRLKLV